ncbi:Stp1/IreP family PP2C-type Ser/Thr phosphatase [Aliikangiella sp. IMCC44359]|uniref:Stp1/IreP family PP2C-type Ser/Thr phosphatase n=1 Tax=Aliikangiella sp. IMCC44359 TaxID=3459125 RepID=UPI00403B03C3
MSDTTIRRKIKWEYAADTNVGMVRQVNEDAILSKPEIGLWAVADGMGGHELGDVASKMIIEALDEVDNKRALDDIVDAVEDELIAVNQLILEYADEVLENKTLGSTIVVLVIRGRVGVCLWVGDSRLYQYRKGQLTQLTQDHSRVGELVQQGLLKPEEAENHPESNIITRAVGVDEDFYVDINVFNVQSGDTFLLCSDGLYNMLDHSELIYYLEEPDINSKVNTLISAALDNGATDNVSAIVVKGGFEKIVVREVIIDE